MAHSTTPTLVTMPTEILCIIGSNLRDDELVGISHVSQRLRHIFIAQRYKSLKFSGTVIKVARTYTRYLTIAINGDRCPELAQHAHAPQVVLTPLSMFLGAIPNLEQVNFNLNFGPDMDHLLFNRCLRKTTTWSSPRSLAFIDKVPLTVFNTVVRHFSPGALEAIQLPSGFNQQHFSTLKTQQAGLKALHVDRTSNKTRDGTFRLLDVNFLNSVEDHFPEMESLILHEDTPEYYEGSPAYISCGWDIHVIPFIGALNAMPRLRRFAFTLEPYHLRRRRRNCPLHGNWACPPRIGYPSHEECYSDVARDILNRVPGLEALCIASHHPTFYRATRENGQIVVQKESRDNDHEQYRFPNVLLG
ncbi:hypothetical protein F53441_3716 [Fusarium austroafricanum]|uniref:F-box domain-containing protein n=1 Tax=Fusarium austroafricanum TaxID=2364996 RepID=A0A8H4PAF6_9HYPO|nr:hypothetical protein F53441_3716 [Fusarium austroafricanum]